MTEPRPPRRPLSSPLAACGAILAALAIVGLARGYEQDRAAPAEDHLRASPGDAGVEDAGGGEVGSLLAGRPIDVNRATEEELQLLPRIGPTLARRIVEERDRNGPFRSLADLGRVRGVGPRTVERLAPLATVEPDRAAPP